MKSNRSPRSSCSNRSSTGRYSWTCRTRRRRSGSCVCGGEELQDLPRVSGAVVALYEAMVLTHNPNPVFPSLPRPTPHAPCPTHHARHAIPCTTTAPTAHFSPGVEVPRAPVARVTLGVVLHALEVRHDVPAGVLRHSGESRVAGILERGAAPSVDREDQGLRGIGGAV